MFNSRVAVSPNRLDDGHWIAAVDHYSTLNYAFSVLCFLFR